MKERKFKGAERAKTPRNSESCGLSRKKCKYHTYNKSFDLHVPLRVLGDGITSVGARNPGKEKCHVF